MTDEDDWKKLSIEDKVAHKVNTKTFTAKSAKYYQGNLFKLKALRSATKQIFKSIYLLML